MAAILATCAAGGAEAASQLRLDGRLSPAAQRPAASPGAGTAPARLQLDASLHRHSAQPGRANADATAAPAVGEVYVDRVLDDSPLDAVDDIPVAEQDHGPLGPGRSLTSIDYDFDYRRRDGATRREHATGLSWTRETLDYGFLSADIAVRTEDDVRRFEDDHGSGRISLRQEGFVIGGGLVADSALGDQTAGSNPLLARSFRFSLPGSYLRGASTRLSDGGQELRVQAGRVGNLSGRRLFTFEASEAELGGIGYQRDLGSDLSTALQVWRLRDDPRTGSHTSAAVAVERRGQGDDRFQLHALGSSGGHLGVWLDGDQQIGGWRHRYGVFRMDPGLRWLDDGIANDREGLYWRSDLRASRYSFNTGVDLVETNIDAAPTVAGSVSASGFARGTWLARRDTQLGGALDFGTIRDGRGADVAEQNRAGTSVFISRRWAPGTSRVQLDTDFTRGEAGDTNGYTLFLDHAWDVRVGASLSTRLRGARQRGASHNDLLALDTLARFEVGNGLSLSADTSAAVSTGRDDRTRSLRLNLGVDWQLSRQWRLDLAQEIVHTRSRAGGVGTVGTELAFFARLRWSEASGAQPAVLGQPGGTPGTGRIIGTVFFDDNRDGVRSPGEEVASDAMVLLDGRRATARTDAQGRFEFWPVFTGPHSVSLRVEELPLPFGLEDEAPVSVTVGARETVSVDFPLVRLDQ